MKSEVGSSVLFLSSDLKIVDFVDVVLSKASRIKVISVLKNFLFSFLSFELVEFKVIARVMFATFETVVLRDFAVKVGLKFFKRFRVEKITSG